MFPLMLVFIFNSLVLVNNALNLVNANVVNDKDKLLKLIK